MVQPSPPPAATTPSSSTTQTTTLWPVMPKPIDSPSGLTGGQFLQHPQSTRQQVLLPEHPPVSPLDPYTTSISPDHTTNRYPTHRTKYQQVYRPKYSRHIHQYRTLRPTSTSARQGHRMKTVTTKSSIPAKETRKATIQPFQYPARSKPNPDLGRMKTIRLTHRYPTMVSAT